jgi:hypothetical protein
MCSRPYLISETELVLIKTFDVKKKIAAVSIVGLLVLLTACTPIISAATVGSKSISISDVQTTVTEIMAERAKVTTNGMNLETGEALNRSQVTFFVISSILDAIGTKNKIVVTDAEVATEIRNVTAQVGGAANLPSAMVNAQIAPKNLQKYFHTYLLSSKISKFLTASGIAAADVTAAEQKLVSDEAAKLNVTINPRYGYWDSARATIVAAPLAAGSVTK